MRWLIDWSGILRLRVVVLATFFSIGTAGQAMEPPPLTQGQTVYVPVYSHLLHGNQDRRGQPDRWGMAAMLSIRNTDPDNSMSIRSVRYYGTDGMLLREYMEQPKSLGAMATTEIFVELSDRTGGTGANFLVVWDAVRPINAPRIETVHTYFFGTQSVAFVSPGQPLHVTGK